MEDERRALAARMTDKAAKLLLDMPLRQMRRLEEMRFYAGQNACFVFDGRGETQNVFFSRRDVDELVTALCSHSRYAYETQLAQGYIPLGNGCRAGVCGRMTTGESGRLSSPTSVCIRVARDVPGASGGVLPYIMGEGGRVCRALLLGPPGCGKTTVLRDAAKKLADMGIRVAVCDEREELFPTGEAEQGIDVMRGVDKAAAVEMLLRAMAPQAVLCDEIGNERDAQALENAARCGVGLLASAHAGTWTDVLRRPILKRLYDGATFERYLLLGHMTRKGRRFSRRMERMWNTAVMAMISLSAIGFAVADGETRRVRWIQAMRRCILRMNDVIRYERLPLAALLARMDLRATREQRELTRLLHLCGERMENSANPQLVELFVREAGRTPSYGVLAEADREAFEQVLGELGRTGLEEQLRILSEADGRLYQREESLRRDAARRAQMIRTLGVTGGAAAFLMLI